MSVHTVHSNGMRAHANTVLNITHIHNSLKSAAINDRRKSRKISNSTNYSNHYYVHKDGGISRGRSLKLFCIYVRTVLCMQRNVSTYELFTYSSQVLLRHSFGCSSLLEGTSKVH